MVAKQHRSKDFVIAICPGHGGLDPGAVGHVVEAEITYRFAQILASTLLRRGYEVWFTHPPPQKEKKVTLEERVEAANSIPKCDLFISVHANASDKNYPHGPEVWTSVGETLSDKYATSICKALAYTEHLRVDESDGDPDKEANFYVLRNTIMPAVLLELGFVSNESDAALLKNNDYLERMARQIAIAIMFVQNDIKKEKEGHA